MAETIILQDRPDRNQSAVQLWAIVCIDKDGNEAIAGGDFGQGMLPLVTTKFENAELLRREARNLVNKVEGMRIVLRAYFQYIDEEL